MNTWLLSWNHELWVWDDYKEASQKTKNNEIYDDSWSCNTKKPEFGDRIFLIKLGKEPKGILASGYVSGESYEAPHWDDVKSKKGETVKKIDVNFDKILDYETDNFLSQEYLNENFPEQTWSPIGSGISIKAEYVEDLEKIWSEVSGAVSFQKYSVPTSVWLATAMLSYETYFSKDKINLAEMYFKQNDIKERAQSICKQKVDGARISQWCNADHSNNTYNYLREGEDSLRRLIVTSEMGGVKERPDDLNEADILKTEVGVITMKDLIYFVDNEYTKLINGGMSVLGIDIESIENYLQSYARKDYKKPDKAGEKANEMQKLREDGIYAREQFIELAKEAIKPFKDYEMGTCSNWINQGQTVPDYFWIEFKKKGYKEIKSSISLFAWKVENWVLFYLAVEARDTACSSEDFKKHNLIITKEINDPELYYFIELKDGEYKKIEYSREEIINRYKAGEYKKIRIQKDIGGPYANTLTNEIINQIQDGIMKLEPYYNMIIGSGGEVIPPMKLNKAIDKNTILYGPPGTGKTYNTVNYAVAIIENKSLEEIINESYDAIYERYKKYKSDGKIVFTTFHQSFGYEEFIEGIKPQLVDDLEDEDRKLEYSIESGMFKKFCEIAKQKEILSISDREIRSNPTVWKVSLEGSKSNSTKTDCFENNRIRIGWPNRDKHITEDSKFDSTKEKGILSYFEYEMQIGDLVVSLYDKEHIDAIGVILGDYEWLEEGSKYPRSRKVKWLIKDIKENIVEINNGTTLTSSTVYKLRNIPVDSLLEIVKKYNFNDNVVVENKKSNYVFIIDEINRGNISKIFGELITLIETTKRLGEKEEMTAKLPYSGVPFGVPNNVYILGTMNTADRSIALMDTALRRRFQFVEMMPDSNVLVNIPEIEGINIIKMLDTINERIEFLFDREHTIGHAYFTCLTEDNTIEKLASIFTNAIIPLLQEYFYEDYSKIQLVLGDNDKEDKYKFVLDTDVKLKNIFKGNPDIDLPEKKYSIQNDAFYKAESYIKIY